MPHMHFKPKEQRHNGREYHTHDPLEQITRTRGRAEDQVKSMHFMDGSTTISHVGACWRTFLFLNQNIPNKG